MAEPRLIRDYLAELDKRLPEAIVEELADGLTQTYRHHLASGLDEQAATRAALAEFGRPATVAAAFTNAAPARHAARTLLQAGPAVGGCWAGALISARAWQWTIPTIIPSAIGAVLAAIIALLLTAAFCRQFSTARRAAGAALTGMIALDVALPGVLVLPGHPQSWPLILAAGLSLARAGYSTSALRRIHIA